MPQTLSRRLPMPGKVVISLVLVGSLSGCLGADFGNSFNQSPESISYDYGYPDEHDPEEQDPVPPLLTTAYGDTFSVSQVKPDQAPQRVAATVTQAYESNGSGPYFVLRGVTSTGSLTGVSTEQAPKPGEFGPVPGNLATVDGGQTALVPISDSLGLAADPSFIGQVVTAGNVLAWTQAVAPKDGEIPQWHVVLQDAAGTQQLLAPTSAAYPVVNTPLGLATTSDSTTIMWHTKAADKETEPQFRSVIERSNSDSSTRMIMTSAAPMDMLVGSHGTASIVERNSRSAVSFYSPYWQENNYWYDNATYREEELVTQLAVGTPLVAAQVTGAAPKAEAPSGSDAESQWIDIFLPQSPMDVKRIPVSPKASNLRACGQMAAWLDAPTEAPQEGTTVHMYDTATDEFIILPQGRGSIGDLFCSATMAATSVFSPDGTYLGVDTITW